MLQAPAAAPILQPVFPFDITWHMGTMSMGQLFCSFFLLFLFLFFSRPA
jgi:hypothetical protein